MASEIGNSGLRFGLATVGFEVHKKHVFTHGALSGPRFDAAKVDMTIGDYFQHGKQDTGSVGWHTEGERGVGSARRWVVAEDQKSRAVFGVVVDGAGEDGNLV